MNVCPNCGYKHANTDYAPELTEVTMPKREREVILRLAQARGSIVHPERLADFLYGDDDDGGPENARSVIQVHISKARKRIEPLGWTIFAERFRGYRLVRAS